MAEPFVRCDSVFKIYKIADVEVVALQGLNLKLAQGEMMALVGPSGVGKSTLLNVVGGLDSPSAGSLWVGGWELLRLKDRDRVQYKREMVGFVWQQPSRNLLPYLSVQENVELPMVHSGVRAGVRERRALELLEAVNLSARADFRPDRLSGGEQQRAALAVALANNPPLLLGDELTGQVDSRSAMRVLDALRHINEAFGTTVVLVTHDPLVAARMDRVVTMRDGRTSTEVRRRWVREEGVASEGAGHLEEEEWAILDPVGRLQLPRSYVTTLELKELVKLHLDLDHVSVWAADADDRQAADVEEPPIVSQLWAVPSLQATGGAEAGLAIRTQNLSRTFVLAGEEVHALREVSLEIPAGSLSAIKGPSGSGKTTLLNVIAGLDEPTSGTVHLDGRSLAEMSAQEKIDLCRQQIGYVFQTFALLPFLTVDENVQVPLRLLPTDPRERQSRVDEALEAIGLAHRAQHRTYELSGGEQQRVAIARALVKRPRLILADEPTGQLDSLTGARIIALLREIATQTGITVLVASHDPSVHEAADWVFDLQDGLLVDRRDQRG